MPDKTPQEQLADTLDSQLLDAIKGDAPSAAMLNVARQRLRDLGMTKVTLPGDPTDELAKELGFAKDPKILKLPPMDDAPDAATA